MSKRRHSSRLNDVGNSTRNSAENLEETDLTSSSRLSNPPGRASAGSNRSSGAGNSTGTLSSTSNSIGSAASSAVPHVPSSPSTDAFSVTPTTGSTGISASGATNASGNAVSASNSSSVIGLSGSQPFVSVGSAQPPANSAGTSSNSIPLILGSSSISLTSGTISTNNNASSGLHPTSIGLPVIIPIDSGLTVSAGAVQQLSNSSGTSNNQSTSQLSSSTAPMNSIADTTGSRSIHQRDMDTEDIENKHNSNADGMKAYNDRYKAGTDSTNSSSGFPFCWPDKHLSVVLPVLVSTREADFIKYKKGIINAFNALGTPEFIELPYQTNVDYAKSYAGPSAIVVHVVRRVQQLAGRLRALLVTSLGKLENQATTLFERKLEAESNSSSSGNRGAVTVPTHVRPVGTFDVYSYWCIIIHLFAKVSIYQAPNLYLDLLSMGQLGPNEDSAVLLEKLHTIDKKIADLKDKPQSCLTINEGMAICLALRSIPDDWNIKQQMQSWQNLTLDSICNAIDQHHTLKSGNRKVVRTSGSYDYGKAHGVFGSANNTNNNKKSFNAQSRNWKQDKFNKGNQNNNSNRRHNNGNSSNSGTSSHKPVHHNLMFSATPAEYSDNDNDDDGEDEADGYLYTQSAMSTNSDGTVIGGQNDWVLDSGATLHTSGADYVKELAMGSPMKITYANGAQVTVKQYGKVKMTSRVTLNGVAHVKGSANLVSLARIIDAGYKVYFFKDKALIKDKNGETVLTFQRQTDSSLWKFERGNQREEIDMNRTIEVHEPFIPRKKRNTGTTAPTTNNTSSTITSASTQARTALTNSRNQPRVQLSSSSSSTASSTLVPANR
jgi:hypothetical protein